MLIAGGKNPELLPLLGFKGCEEVATFFDFYCSQMIG
jgi:hypothetical protein